MIGIETDSPETAKGFQAHCLENGVLVNVCHGNVVRLIPPLIVGAGEKDVFMELFRSYLG
jgi:acetylornithine aminotransferase/acetylornithine/N-succinyldiaminopimelate aminotransferase